MEPKRNNAILLAAILGFWALLYTFEKDWRKFLIGFGVNILGLLSLVAARNGIRGLSSPPSGTFTDGTAIGALLIGSIEIALFLWVVTWVLALMNAVNKTPQAYAGYGSKSKKAAILLAVLFGPFGWLYTYDEDAKKFWISISIVVAACAVIPVFLANNNISWVIKRIIRGHSTISEGLEMVDIGGALLYYFHGDLKPVLLLIPGLAWASAVVSSVVKRKLGTHEKVYGA